MARYTAFFDLVTLFWAQLFLAYSLVTGNVGYLKVWIFWMLIHMAFTTFLVSTVVGIKEALLGLIPYTIVNFYNKWLYLCAMTRELILGRHYKSWTGRQGRATEISPMTPARKGALVLAASVIGAGVFAFVARSIEVGVVAGWLSTVALGTYWWQWRVTTSAEVA